MSNSVEADISDEEVNPKTHKKLLEAVSRLGKNQHIRKPTRREPTLKQDEFHLVKSTSDSVGKVQDSSVSVNDLVQLLNKTQKHLDSGKELKNTVRNKKVLEKPLEKHEADKIRSLIGYEKAKKKISRWDAVVTRNRVIEQQIFPLDNDEFNVRSKSSSRNKPTELSLKNELMVEMEAIEKKLRTLKGEKPTTEEEEDEKKIHERLTREELIARRKELAYIRTRESQQSAKARLRNKIKSKKYHKFLKREKLKEQIKEFEMLQKMNPEAALAKLEKLEKNRVLERASLRHKNTGTWAKNLQIRAKYDKDVRKDLADQLAISRELTEKKQKLEEEEEEDEQEDDNKFEEDDGEEVDPFNPWVKKHKNKDSDNEVANFISGYRKYWLERNENEENLKKYKENGDSVEKANGYTEGNRNEVNSESSEDSDAVENLKNFKVFLKSKAKSSLENKTSREQSTGKKNRQKSKRENKQNGIKKISKRIIEEDGWVVEDLNKDFNESSKNCDESDNELKDIDDIFDEAEDLIEEKVARKLEEFKSKLSKESRAHKQKKNKNTMKTKDKSYLDLSFKPKATVLDLDEELNETTEAQPSIEQQNFNENLSLEINSINRTGMKNDSSVANSRQTSKNDEGEIDPNKFVNIKPKMLKSSLPEQINENDFFDEDSEDNDVRKITISEAFQDDDVVAEFQKEREEEKKKNVNEIDLTLPGWGSWAGCGISKTLKKKRLVLKLPEAEKRRDENKPNVYINENENKKLKEHLISDLPFPFTCVQDFEASIRTPIGRTFLPESAFRMLTRPSVITKQGQIIEPMDESVLMKAPKRPRNVVDARIEEMSKKKKEKIEKS